MCFHTQQTQDAQRLEKRFKSKVKSDISSKVKGSFNGFTFPFSPVISQDAPHQIALFKWGLMPPWESDLTFAKNTLNARIETIESKPSFKQFVRNRCLILVDGFLEWQWLDSKGKQKQGFLIRTADEEPFSLGGIYSQYVDKETGEKYGTYSIVTTEANALMAEIHNTKKRMPLVLHANEEAAWLAGETPLHFQDRSQCQLIAQPFGPAPSRQNSLF